MHKQNRVAVSLTTCSNPCYLGKILRFEKASKLMLVHASGKNDTFSPVREKVSKERTFVCAELTPYKSENETVCKVSIGTHYSGGIIALSAKMKWCEYRFAADSAFEDGRVLRGQLASSVLGKDKVVIIQNIPQPQHPLRQRSLSCRKSQPSCPSPLYSRRRR